MKRFNCDFGSRFRILKGGKISLVVSAILSSTTLVFAAPTGGTVTSGSANISQSGNTTNITQSTNKATINWQDFSIKSNETVNFKQPDVNSITLNRVVGNERSIIDGALNANGQVWILNSNGILFNKDSKINTAGILATTKNITDADFNAGNYKFTGDSTAGVINMGTIEASDSGYVALLANTVQNNGTIKAYKGTVHLTGASEATINLNGNSIVSLTVNKGVLDALVENKGAVLADGGKIYLTTNAVDEILKGVVNNTGLIEANSLDDLMGKIDISSNMVINNGTVKASGQIGGKVNVKASLIIDGGITNVDGVKDAGTITQNSVEILQSSTAKLSANSSTANAGKINLISDTKNESSGVYLSGEMTAKGVNGGEFNTTASKVTLNAAKVNTSGTNKAGNVKIGGGWQGSDTTIANAKNTNVLNSTITNSGKDGQIVIWSDNQTNFSSKILAKNSITEISSKNSLGFASKDVQVKSLLLDPKNIVITDEVNLDYFTISNPNNTAGDGFGTITLQLSGGNYVITAPNADVGGIIDVGRVYLYSSTGTLISTLSGTQANDKVGIEGVTALTNGNYVVNSVYWDNGTTTDVGAVTWVNGTTGINGVVSTSNSLYGTTRNEQVGIGGVTALTNGNYVVNSYNWKHGSNLAKYGAVTWGDGTTGIIGEVSTSNSLYGTASSDQVGSRGVTALTNGNYVVNSSSWKNGAASKAGAVTWGDGTTGIIGAVSTSNSLYGTTAYDEVGSGGVTALTNGNYVVSSFNWNNGTTGKAGAVTWGDGTTGIIGAVSTSNSLYGTTFNDQVGGVTALTNGNYVVRSYNWDNGPTVDVGAVTWGNGITGIIGAVSTSNSLYGTTASDQVGSKEVTALTNGNYVVRSYAWNNGAASKAGAVTWGDGTIGINGAVSSLNSLVGTTADDNVGGVGVTALTNGNYVVISSYWDNGTTANVGAVTWGDGTTGIIGAVNSLNSLVGTTASDQVGSRGVTSLTNGNYVVNSRNWNNGVATFAGAVTWGDGTTGITGEVSTSNSLFGTTANDQVGYGGVTALTNGNYVVNSYNWDNGAISNAGAVTWGNGTTGVKGAVSSSNSLVGTTDSDYVGNSGILALADGTYVVCSSLWNNGITIDAGAVTWGSATGITGTISSANSILGMVASAYLGTTVTTSYDKSKALVSYTTSSEGGKVYVLSGYNNDSISSATFSNNPAADSIITPDSITAILNLGTNVILQANNDITVTNNIIANNDSGDGGDLTLEAGRNININANIVTDSGNFTAIAGSSDASSTNTDTGTPTITIASGVSINAGTGTIKLYANEGNFVNNAGATPFTASLTKIYLPSYTNATLGGLTVAGKRYNTTYAGGCLTAECELPTSGVNLLYALVAKLTVTPTTGQTATYGDTITVSGNTISGYVNGDTSTTSGISGTATYTIGGTKTTSGNYIAGAHDIAYDTGLLSSLGYTFVDASSETGELTITEIEPTPTPTPVPNPEPTPTPIKQDPDIEKAIASIVNNATTNVNVPKDILVPKVNLGQNAPILPMTPTVQTSAVMQNLGKKLGLNQGEELSLVSTVLEGQTTEKITLGELKELSEDSNNPNERRNTPIETRVALGDNSIVELVNGGVSLPEGVDQEFYVTKNKKNKK